VSCNQRCWCILWPLEIFFSAIWYILLPFGNLVVVWYIFPRFGIFYQQKSGNPVSISGPDQPVKTLFIFSGSFRFGGRRRREEECKKTAGTYIRTHF
jgi:hypothetical protein